MLESDRVILRNISISDVNDEYYQWLNDPENNSGLAKDHYSIEEIKKYVSEKSIQKDCYFFAIIDKEKHKFIGTVKLDNFDPKAYHMEFGILIGDKNYHGKSYGKEVCTLVLNFAFQTLNLNKVWLAVYENNIAAQKLYKKLGFEVEGIQKKHVVKNNQFFDKILMAIFKDQWIKNKK